jgi:hypothetical protein
VVLHEFGVSAGVGAKTSKASDQQIEDLRGIVSVFRGVTTPRRGRRRICDPDPEGTVQSRAPRSPAKPG